MAGRTGTLLILNGRGVLSRPATFWWGMGALILQFCAAGVPVPLYGLFQERSGVPDWALAGATVAYLCGLMATLLGCARVSDRVGRIPVAVIALLMAACGAVVLVLGTGLAALVGGRLLQGLAGGLASVSLATLLVESAGLRRRRLAVAAASTFASASVPLGGLLSGILASGAPFPRELGLSIAAALLVIVALVIVLGEETAPGVRASEAATRGSADVATGVPAGVPSAVPDTAAGVPGRSPAKTFLFFGLVVSATWPLGAFVQTYSAGIAHGVMGVDHLFVSGVFFAVLFLFAPLGALMATRMEWRRRLLLGTLVYVVAVSGLAASLLLEEPKLYLAASVLGSIGNGLVMSVAIDVVLRRTPASGRSRALSWTYAISYGSSIVGGFLDFGLVAGLGVVGAGVAHCAFAGFMALAALMMARRDHEPQQLTA